MRVGMRYTTRQHIWPHERIACQHADVRSTGDSLMVVPYNQTPGSGPRPEGRPNRPMSLGARKKIVLRRACIPCVRLVTAPRPESSCRCRACVRGEGEGYAALCCAAACLLLSRSALCECECEGCGAGASAQAEGRQAIVSSHVRPYS
jgi:hypothetical protein